MQILKRSLLLVGLAAFALTACKDDDPAAPQATVNSVTVTPDLVTLRVAQTVTLVANVDVENGAATTVNWSTSDQARATVTAAGVVTAGTTTGPVVITATSTVDATKKGTATINVVAGQVLSVEVLPTSVTLFGAQTAQMAAVVNAEATVPTTVTWSITPVDNSVASINATTGVVTAAANNTLLPRTAVVTATSTADPSKKGAATVIVNPGQPATGVLNVQVSPNSASMRFGEPNTVFTAQVTTSNPSVPTTVTWSVSDATKATIVSSTTSTVTIRPTNATVSGQVAVVATSTADAGKSGAAVFNILPPLTPATASINSINIGSTLLPVNPLAVAGQIDVIANVDPGDFIVTKVELLIDDRVVATQNLAPSADPAAEVSQVVLSYNTATYAVVGLTPNATEPALPANCLAGGPAAPAGHACVDFLNGQHRAKVRITTTSGSTNGSAESVETDLTFVNVSGYHNRTTPPSNNAIGVNGQIWYGGPAGPNATVASWPVRYDGRTISTLTHCISDLVGAFGPFGAGFPGGSSTCNTDNSAPFSSQLFVSASNQILPARAFGFVAMATASDLLPVAAVPVSAGNGQALLDAEIAISIDNTAPSMGSYFMNMTAPAQDSWANAAYSFSGGGNYTGTSDAGVGLGGANQTLAQRMAGGFTTFRYWPTCGAGAGVPVLHSNQTTNVTANDITPSTCNFTNSAFQGDVSERDRLGNEGNRMLATSNPPINSNDEYGVDKVNPLIRERLAGLPHANGAAVALLGAAPHFQVEIQDDRAGFGDFPLRHQLVTASHATAAAIPSTNLPSDALCLVGSGNPGTSFLSAPACGLTLVADNNTFALDGFLQGPPIDLTAAPANGLAGYYWYQATAFDKAANSVVGPSRRIALDPVAAVLTGASVPFLFTAAQGNTAANAVVSTFSDDVEVISGTLRLVYPEVPGANTTLAYPRTFLGGTDGRFDNFITSPGQFSHSVPMSAPFVRSIRTVDGGNAPQATVGGKPSAANVRVWDVLGTTASNILIPAIPPGNVENGVDFITFNGANPLLAIQTFRILPQLTAVGFIPAGLKAQVIAPSNAINPPFVRVDFYRLNAGDYEYLGSASGSVTGAAGGVTSTDEGTNRGWTYVIGTAGTVNTPAALTLQGTIAGGNNIIAVGVTAAGDGLVTLPLVL